MFYVAGTIDNTRYRAEEYELLGSIVKTQVLKRKDIYTTMKIAS